MGVETTEIDLGFKAFVKELKELEKQPFVKVGFPEKKEKKHSDSGESLTLIASVQEFGTADGKIPERSFMRASANRISKDMIKFIAAGIQDIYTLKASTAGLLGRIGVKVKGEVQSEITNVTSPANKASTVASKGSSSPLIDQGQMRQAVTFEVVKDGRG